MTSNTELLDLSRSHFQQELAEYAERYEIFQLFHDLSLELALERPSNPLDFIIESMDRIDLPKVVILGPPGVGKQTQVTRIEQQYGCDVIVTRAILEEASRSGTPEGDQIAADMRAGRLVRDSVVIRHVLARLRQPSCRERGWVLHGFPRTHAQAIALQAASVLPRHVFVLDAPDAALHARTAHTDPACYARRLAEYRLHEDAVRRCYRNAQHIDALGTVEDVAGQIAAHLSARRPIALAPQPALRVVLLGMPQSGKRTQQRLVADALGLVPIEAISVVEQAIKSDPAMGEQLAPYITANVPLPDTLVTPLFRERLARADCRRAGWIMTGFPSTEAQAALLREVPHLHPTHVLLLRTSKETALSRASAASRGEAQQAMIAGSIDQCAEDLASVVRYFDQMPILADPTTAPCPTPGCVAMPTSPSARARGTRSSAEPSPTIPARFVTVIDAEADRQNVLEQIQHVLRQPRKRVA